MEMLGTVYFFTSPTGRLRQTLAMPLTLLAVCHNNYLSASHIRD